LHEVPRGIDWKTRLIICTKLNPFTEDPDVTVGSLEII
jgi:hypothetical protein